MSGWDLAGIGAGVFLSILGVLTVAAYVAWGALRLADRHRRKARPPGT